ncbi:UV DNA damage repair endonuclease UvsE [Salirhabdus salicampi]|uniref:UV DNA damage repair endonuclease UvsE n=1 Tax=Salirhabdus salicampi TaxID=476102 RepID=UPI0020C2AB41|nr:UV DNA damage repair endonuclease UvsE [Salirhabdus salicampi]MCP8616141.1 UV DNA damage repair endonuclease UvsE [Salirhabdus salicampi]
MTLFRLGYVAMSVHVKNASPSQTMTYNQFEKIRDREAAVRKLELIAKTNINNCLRLLKHNAAHDIRFFRLSSKLVPLATHDELRGWNFIRPIKEDLKELGKFATEKQMRIDFHPDHFVVLNSPTEHNLKSSIILLKYHRLLLKGMGLDSTHRCVIHLGGAYKDKEESLERFVSNWGTVPRTIQNMVMLENDDKTYNIQDVLYVCEKLNIPMVFDLHHHLANHLQTDWQAEWERILTTWEHSPYPIKMHISSPKSSEQFRHHANYIDPKMFLQFVHDVNGSVDQIDCMIEAKMKDHALFKLMEALKKEPSIEVVDGASFYVKEK